MFEIFSPVCFSVLLLKIHICWLQYRVKVCCCQSWRLFLTCVIYRIFQMLRSWAAVVDEVMYMNYWWNYS